MQKRNTAGNLVEEQVKHYSMLYCVGKIVRVLKIDK